MNFNLHFCELHSDNSINDKNNLFENSIPKCDKVKRILISYNCLSLVKSKHQQKIFSQPKHVVGTLNKKVIFSTLNIRMLKK